MEEAARLRGETGSKEKAERQQPVNGPLKKSFGGFREPGAVRRRMAAIRPDKKISSRFREYSRVSAWLPHIKRGSVNKPGRVRRPARTVGSSIADASVKSTESSLQVTPVPNTRCLARASDINQPVYEPYNYSLLLTCVSQKTVHSDSNVHWTLLLDAEARTVFCTLRRAIARRAISLQNAFVSGHRVTRTESSVDRIL